jgi:hypothetical protein
VRGQNQQSADHETAHDDRMEALQDFHASQPCKGRDFPSTHFDGIGRPDPVSALRDEAGRTGFAGGQRDGLETGTEVHDKMPPRCRHERTGAVEFEDEARGIHAGSESPAPQLPRRRREGERLWRPKPSPIGKRE